MDRIDSFIAFSRAVEQGSFSAAARQLGITQPTVSKHIAALEAHLNVRLFTRTARRLKPTEDAIRIYDHVRQLLEDLETVERSVAGKTEEPEGVLRISVPVSFGEAFIVPRLQRFMHQYPKVVLDVQITDRVIDLFSDGVELAVRIGELPSSTLVARRIGTARHIVAASASYLSTHPEPVIPEDLVGHQCVIYQGAPTGSRWIFESDLGRRSVEVSGPLYSDNANAIAHAVVNGVGIGMLPDWVLRPYIDTGAVQVLLDEYDVTRLPINLVYPERRWVSRRARCFIDFLASELERLD